MIGAAAVRPNRPARNCHLRLPRIVLGLCNSYEKGAAMYRFSCAILGLVLGAQTAAAANMQSHCIALSQTVPGVRYVALGDKADLASDEVRLHYTGHSTFLLETATGLSVATDFTGYVGPNIVPDVVTMNRAHESHYTDFPDPAIKHVLKGWGTADAPADHRLDLEEMLIRNVTTDIRSRFGGVETNQNSIFIFEVAGLCIGHLGHLHHEPSDAQYALMGRMDVVMAPVDGGLTLDSVTMARVLKRLRASAVLPMHWFGDGTLGAFLAGLRDDFAIEYADDTSYTVSLRTLPRRPTIIVLRPRPVAP